MRLIQNWRGAQIQVVDSAGGTAVFDPWDNLVRAGIHLWPPLELISEDLSE